MVCGNRGLAALADDTALVRLAHPTHATKTSASTQVCSSLRVFTVCLPNALAFSGLGAAKPVRRCYTRSRYGGFVESCKGLLGRIVVRTGYIGDISDREHG